MKYSYSYETPVGRLWLAEEDDALTDLSFGPVPNAAVHESPLLRHAAQQLKEYFAGERRDFDLQLDTRGTVFQKSVWSALRDVPYGKTCSYKDIATAVGKPAACRAVGSANNKNPIAIIIPCHRIVGADGSLTGYGGGLDVKQSLLDLEQRYK